MSAMKKDFSGANPNLKFISTTETDAETNAEVNAVTEALTEALKPLETSNKIVKPARVVKSKRLQLLISEDTYKALKKSAKANGVSMNEIVNQAIAHILEAN